ncbi:MAG: 3-dehydroquinate synthase [Clostridia bacterium]|nr:3-dehydroquinate synthase [Clostridia bacterium]
MKTIKINLGENSYNVHVGKGLINEAKNLFDLDRKVLVVTDDGVPSEYAKQIAEQCKEAYIVTVPQGEGSKSIVTFSTLLSEMLCNGFNRNDCAVAVGGGVVGDLTGFAASAYMRGIDFYNIPTTVLSQVDSSVGGKTGINFGGVKNTVGAFKQPKGVIADINTLASLPNRQVSNGLCEALKMAATFDAALFEIFENESPTEQLEKIIAKSIEIKVKVVEEDEKESGLRRVLNFGHTVGHGIESLGLGYYHGECVALGMIPMCADDVRKRLIPILKKLNLPTESDFDIDKAFEAVSHDKKSTSSGINAVFCNEIGTYTVKKVTLSELFDLAKKI